MSAHGILWKTVAIAAPAGGPWFNIFENGPHVEPCPALLLQEDQAEPVYSRTVFATAESPDDVGQLVPACDLRDYVRTVTADEVETVLAALKPPIEVDTWLKDYLTQHDGRSLRSDAINAAADLGLDADDVKRAAHRLGVRFERTREVPSRMFWTLPQEAAK